MVLIYRKAEKNDIDQIANLITNLIGTCDFDEKSTDIKNINIIKKKNVTHLKFNVNNYYVCAFENKILGACGISDVISTNNYRIKRLNKYREILYLVVDNNYQRQGIGSNLLNMCLDKNEVPIIYEAWGDNGEYVNSKFLLERLGFRLIKNLGNDYYKEKGYCAYCVNRNKYCNSCLAEIWIKD